MWRGLPARSDLRKRGKCRPIPDAVPRKSVRPGRRQSPEVVRSHLESVIKAEEFPPPSLAAVCRRIPVCQTVAKRMWPDLAIEIMSRYKTYRTERRRARELFRKLEVEIAFNRLLQEGRPLNTTQLGKVLSPGISLKDRKIRLEFERLRKEAEDEMQAAM